MRGLLTSIWEIGDGPSEVRSAPNSSCPHAPRPTAGAVESRRSNDHPLGPAVVLRSDANIVLPPKSAVEGGAFDGGHGPRATLLTVAIR